MNIKWKKNDRSSKGYKVLTAIPKEESYRNSKHISRSLLSNCFVGWWNAKHDCSAFVTERACAEVVLHDKDGQEHVISVSPMHNSNGRSYIVRL